MTLESWIVSARTETERGDPVYQARVVARRGRQTWTQADIDRLVARIRRIASR